MRIEPCLAMEPTKAPSATSWLLYISVCAYRELGYEEPQPIFKTWLHIYHINENLMIKIVQVDGDARGGGGGVAPVVGVAANDEAFQSLLIRQQAQEQRMEQNQQATLGVIAE